MHNKIDCSISITVRPAPFIKGFSTVSGFVFFVFKGEFQLPQDRQRLCMWQRYQHVLEQCAHPTISNFGALFKINPISNLQEDKLVLSRVSTTAVTMYSKLLILTTAKHTPL